MFLCLWLHWVLVAVVRIFIHLTSDETGPLHWEHGVSAREIPGARVFREVIKFKRGHGVKPLKEERGIRELPLPSENAGRKDRDMKTQRTAVYKAVVSLDLSLLTSETVRKQVCCSRHPVWYFVMVAGAD